MLMWKMSGGRGKSTGARKERQKHEKVWSVQPLTVLDGLTVSAGLRRSGESAEKVSQTLWSWKKLRLSPDDGERTGCDTR